MKVQTAEERKAFAEVFSGMNWHDPIERHAVATEIIKYVVNDTYQQDLIGRIADLERFGPGEELQFHILDELNAYVIEPGGYLPRTFLSKKVVTLPKHRIGVSVELDIKQLRSGRYGTVNDIRRKVGEALLGSRNKLAWDTLFASIGTGDSNYYSFASGATANTKKAVLDDAITYVHDNTNNGPMAIVGRFSALDWIEDISGDLYFSDDHKNEIITRTGFLGQYKGVPIYRLRGYKDRDEEQKINANHIMVLSEGTLKFGEVDPGLEVFDNLRGTETFGWEIAFWEEYGCVVVDGARNAHIQIT